LSESGRKRPPAGLERSHEALCDLGPEEYGILYLREEIEWHRRAGRTLFYFIVGAGGTLGALLIDVSNRPSGPDFWSNLARLLPALVPVVFIVVASWFFWKYYREIVRFKTKAQSLIALRIEDPQARLTFSSLYQGKR